MYRKMFTGMICLMLLGGPSLSRRVGPTNRIEKRL